jgi:hypothetical protein
MCYTSSADIPEEMGIALAAVQAQQQVRSTVDNSHDVGKGMDAVMER